jgi:hypothetical protein
MSVDGIPFSDRSPEMDRTLAPGVEPPIEDNFLGLGGCESDKDSSQLDNEMGQSIKKKVIGSQARVGEASCLGGADSSNLDGSDVCGAGKIGVIGSKLALFTKDEPLVCEPLSCCSPLAYSWVLQKVKVIWHVVGLSCEGFEGQFLAFFTAIEASHNQEECYSNSKSVIRSLRELKRLSCSINSDSSSGCSSRSKVKGKGSSVHS